MNLKSNLIGTLFLLFLSQILIAQDVSVWEAHNEDNVFITQLTEMSILPDGIISQPKIPIPLMNNVSSLFQIGDYNDASVIQNGEDNYSAIVQYGNYNEAGITISGNSNFAFIGQKGNSNYAYREIKGDTQDFMLFQIGNGNYFNVGSTPLPGMRILQEGNGIRMQLR